MRTSKLTLCFATLCMLASPVMAAPSEPERPAAVQDTPARRTATADELDQYAQREQQAQKLEEFKGGRGGTIELTTLLIIVLIVLLVVLIV